MKRVILPLAILFAGLLTALSIPAQVAADDAPGTSGVTQELLDDQAVAANLPTAREVVDRYLEVIGGRKFRFLSHDLREVKRVIQGADKKPNKTVNPTADRL